MEELLRFRGVDEGRNVEPGNLLPDRAQLGIVYPQARAIRLFDRESEALREFTHANRSGLNVCLKLCLRLLAPSVTDVPEVNSGQQAKAIAVGTCVDSIHRVSKFLTRKTVGCDIDPDIQGIEFGNHLYDLLARSLL